MMNAASTSNPSFIVDVGEAYPYPSHVFAPNFVTVKLSGKNKYKMWKTQILCLLKGHHMLGFIDGQFPSPAGNGKGKEGDMEAWVASDSLVKGWILGSLSEEAFNKVVDHLTHKQKSTDFTAKDLWDELQRSYGPSVREQAAETKSPTRQAESEIEESSISEDAKSKEKPTEEKTEEEKRAESVIEVSSISEDAESKDGSTEEITEIEAYLSMSSYFRRKIYQGILRGNTSLVIKQIEKRINPWDELTNNGSTILHVAVSSSTENHELLKTLLEKTPKERLLDLMNSDGSSLLHVAAIGGNTEVVNMLVERNPELLLAKDKEGHIPLALSVSNMHIKTSRCLF